MRTVACCARSKRVMCRREIQKSAYEYQQAIDSGDQIIVGVNPFVGRKSSDSDPAHRSGRGMRPSLTGARLARPPRFRARSGAMPQVERRARTGENLMPAIRGRRGVRHRGRNFRRHAPRLR